MFVRGIEACWRFVGIRSVSVLLLCLLELQSMLHIIAIVVGLS